eukprot:14327363-Ditylum_brightwellii.AAC.1
MSLCWIGLDLLHCSWSSSFCSCVSASYSIAVWYLRLTPDFLAVGLVPNPEALVSDIFMASHLVPLGNFFSKGGKGW